MRDRKPWRAPQDGGYHPAESIPEPTQPPCGPAGASNRVTADVPDPRFHDQLAGPVLIARCENVREPDGEECPGRLRYGWGQIEAACDTCGGRCGIAVAAWLDVQPNAEVEARVQAAANQRAAVIAEEVRELARRYGGRDVPVSTVKVARRLRTLATALAQPAPGGEPT